MAAMTRLLLAAVLSLAALPACENPEAKVHERYLEARRKFAAVYARTLSDECSEEPDCSDVIAVLQFVPPTHSDHADAASILERIRVARARRAAVKQDVENANAAPPPVFPDVDTGEGGSKKR
jgi:hypothetical protein